MAALLALILGAVIAFFIYRYFEKSTEPNESSPTVKLVCSECRAEFSSGAYGRMKLGFPQYSCPHCSKTSTNPLFPIGRIANLVLLAVCLWFPIGGYFAMKSYAERHAKETGQQVLQIDLSTILSGSAPILLIGAFFLYRALKDAMLLLRK